MTARRSQFGSLSVPDLLRSTDDRVVAGVCGGLGAQLGIDPMVIRLAMVVLTLANGVGLATYCVAWVLLPEAGPDAPLAPSSPTRRRTTERAAGVGLVTLGTVLLIRQFGLLLPGELVWSVSVCAVGFSIVWTRTSGVNRMRMRDLALGTSVDGARATRSLIFRAVVGGSLLIIGLALLFASGGVLSAVGQLGLAMLATGVGVGLLLGPWIVRLWRDLDTERRHRIRSEERSEMAAHLHDSVLQTLTLIQRHADAPGRARMLARRQERELRAWLFDDRAPVDGAAASLVAALEQIVTEVEDQHEVAVDLVLVGDAPVDRSIDSFVSALREATNNAARHSGAPEVSLYVEVEPERITAFVRDRGAGFDPRAVEPGRLGISGSIVGRMQRLGGKAEVHSTVGEGTEVALEIPRANGTATS